MTEEPREKERWRNQQVNQAINLAMQGRWGEAARVNRVLLEQFPLDVDAQNRLGKALMELGEYLSAKDAYTRSLELDPYNRIASRNLHRLGYLEEPVSAPRGGHRKFAPHLFIQESGKTAVMSLRQLAPKESLARIATGDEVYLRVKKRRLVVQDTWGSYIGEIETKYELRLIKLIEAGNRYSAVVGSIDEDEVRVIVRETYGHPSQAGRPSFHPEGANGLRVFEETEEEGSALDYALEGQEESTEDGEEEVEEKGRKEDFILSPGFHEVLAPEEPAAGREDGDWDSHTSKD